MHCWYCDVEAPKSDLFRHMWNRHHTKMIKKTRSERRPEVQPSGQQEKPQWPRLTRVFQCFLVQNSGPEATFTILGFNLHW